MKPTRASLGTRRCLECLVSLLIGEIACVPTKAAPATPDGASDEASAAPSTDADGGSEGAMAVGPDATQSVDASGVDSSVVEDASGDAPPRSDGTAPDAGSDAADSQAADAEDAGPSVDAPSDAVPETSTGDGGCPDPADKSDAGLMAPAVSFATDVIPIFQSSCGIAGATCHGDPSATAYITPFLGYYGGGTDAGQVRSGLVAVPSREAPGLSLVAPGDLARSFLWLKVDNLQCTAIDDCADGGSRYPNCGYPMPYGNPPLRESDLDTIARWIVQGGKGD